jgi:glycine/D-amino acid oxidase-like deaminating enzyme
MRILICGGGVIGAAIAYFLSLKQAAALVIERSGVACAASGKSGGFLALDWCDGSPLGRLARRSFELHAELASEFDGRWGYRRLETLSVAAGARRPLGSASRLASPDWVAQGAIARQRLGTTATTAQVHPAEFTRGMMEAAIARGAHLRIGRASGVQLNSGGRGRVRGVVVDGELIEGDAVVIAMGPWSVLASQWLPMPMIYGLKGHSVILRNPIPISPHALFVECEAEDGSVDTPEVFPRSDGTTYVCGLSSEAPLPLDPTEVTSDAGAQARLKAMIRTFAPALADAHVVAAQACYRPVTRDGLPLMGHVPGVDGAYVATGHSVWGMLNAPATGEAMAELILTGATQTVDISAFDPARLPPLSRAAAERMVPVLPSRGRAAARRRDDLRPRRGGLRPDRGSICRNAAALLPILRARSRNHGDDSQNRASSCPSLRSRSRAAARELQTPGRHGAHRLLPGRRKTRK